MSNDTELMELCKEVYKRTGWKPIDFTIPKEGEDIWSGKPLYTSDYLLEKLPAKVRSMNIEIIKRHDGTWYAGYSYGHDVNDDNAEIFIHAEASTLLYTSLKLAIALDDAGELSHV